MANKNTTNVDLHVHSFGSNDAVYSIEEILEIAKKNNIEYLSITDHNTFSEIRKFYKKHGFDLSQPIIEVDRIKIISGVEVTCRIEKIRNLKGNSTKLHLLLYGGDMSPHSPISKLLDLKRKNDIDCDIGMLRDLLKKTGHYQISEDDIRDYINNRRLQDPSFQSLGKKDIWHFLVENKITIASSYKELCEMISTLPKYERLNIEMSDLVKIANASGCEIVIAHPAVNIERVSNANKRILVDYLVPRVNGFEKYYPGQVDGVARMIRDCVHSRGKQRDIYYTGGSDFHDCSSGEDLGVVKGKDLKSNLCEQFISNINKLNRARANGKLSHRKINTNPDEINALLNKYRNYYNQIVLNSGESSLQSERPLKSQGAKKNAKKGKNGYTAKEREIMRKARDEWNNFKSGLISSKDMSEPDDNPEK
ncbi:MAG: PHP domain-containing protein [Christensenellales bacterium]